MKLFPEKRSQVKFLIIRWIIILTIVLGIFIYMTDTPGRSYSGPFKPLSQEEIQLRDNLKKHVMMLSDTIGERNMRRYNQLRLSRDYISEELSKLGIKISYQGYELEGKTVENIEAEIPGKSKPDEIIIIGAHYDSFLFCPGANDNASGVAALIEIARYFSNKEISQTLRFVAFVNEEPPHFKTEKMGSYVYATRSRQQEENVIAMFSLETIGYFSDKENSQQYPIPFSLLYPDTGNFIGFVSNLSSRKLMRDAIRTFRDTTDFPSEGVAAPQWITGIDWSDHWSFWEKDYKALMITDTAPFRYKYYHTEEDTWEKLDFDQMARVVVGIVNVITELYE